MSRYPSSDRDLAFVVDDGVAAAEVEAALARAAGELLERVWLFDTYRGPGVPEGARSSPRSESNTAPPSWTGPVGSGD